MTVRSTLAAGLVALAIGAGTTCLAAGPATECDRLAAHPLDEHRVAPGVGWHGLDGEAALAACDLALAHDPDEPRFAYQRARALDRLGRTEQAMPIYAALAAQGYAAAGTMLGYLHAAGDGVPKDLARAAALFQAAAEQGHPEAQLQLGLMLKRGIDIAPDRALAAQWLERSAMQGYRDGQLALADLLADEARASFDEAKFHAAARWYELAAKQGSDAAALALGRLTLEGRGIERDVGRSIALLRPPARNGTAEAQYWLAIALGADGEAGNDDGAEHWYLRAAQQDYAPAQVALVGVYLNGSGSAADAYLWARMFARHAPRYERVAEHIARNLNSVQIALADAEVARLSAEMSTPETTP